MFSSSSSSSKNIELNDELKPPAELMKMMIMLNDQNKESAKNRRSSSSYKLHNKLSAMFLSKYRHRMCVCVYDDLKNQTKKNNPSIHRCPNSGGDGSGGGDDDEETKSRNDYHYHHQVI